MCTDWYMNIINLSSHIQFSISFILPAEFVSNFSLVAPFKKTKEYKNL